MSPKNRWNSRFKERDLRRGQLLKMTFSKAQHLLRKMLIKKYFEVINQDACYRCFEKIDDLDFHIDHVESWQGAYDPIASFFNIENIRISHPLCNSLARSRSDLYGIINYEKRKK